MLLLGFYECLRALRLGLLERLPWETPGGYGDRRLARRAACESGAGCEMLNFLRLAPRRGAIPLTDDASPAASRVSHTPDRRRRMIVKHNTGTLYD